MEIESLEIRSAIAKIEYDITNMWKQIYPVGSIYLTIGSATPEDLFGGTWERVGVGQYLLGVDPSDETGKFDISDRTGGSFEHTLTIDEMPSHTHIQNQHSHVGLRWGDQNDDNQAISLNGGGWAGYHLGYEANVENGTQNSIVTKYATATNQNTGGGQPFNITPPFYTVYMWKRIG